MMHDSAPMFAAILAAGSSCRMGRDKFSLSFGGKSPVELSIEAFSGMPHKYRGHYCCRFCGQYGGREGIMQPL